MPVREIVFSAFLLNPKEARVTKNCIAFHVIQSLGKTQLQSNNLYKRNLR